MNNDQLASVVRTAMKIVSGLLAAHGLADTATILNAPDVVSAVLLIVSVVWSHYSHASSPPKPAGGSTTGGLTIILAFVAASFLFTGCASLDPGARPVVVRTEQSLTVANATFDSAVHIDEANRAFFQTNLPPFHTFCEWLRTPVIIAPLTNSFPRGLAIIRSTTAVKNTYKTTNSTNDYALLISSLATLENATAQAQQFISVINAK